MRTYIILQYGCVGPPLHFYTLVITFITIAQALFADFTMAALRQCVAGIAALVQRVVPALSDCGVDAIVGKQLIAEIG